MVMSMITVLLKVALPYSAAADRERSRQETPFTGE